MLKNGVSLQSEEQGISMVELLSLASRGRKQVHKGADCRVVGAD
jgi:hypothetical protein